MSELLQDEVTLMGPTKYFERGSPLEMLLVHLGNDRVANTFKFLHLVLKLISTCKLVAI
jgi:hypothetical protein